MSENFPVFVVAIVAVLTVTGFIPMGGAFEGRGESGPISPSEIGDRFDEVDSGHTDLLEQTSVYKPVQEYAQDSSISSAGWVEMPGEDCIAHPPIHIQDDEQFRLPGSGVVNPLAEGNDEDPFIIEGWCIDGDAGTLSGRNDGIRIEETQAHVMVQLNQVTNHEGHGISLEGAENVIVRENRIIQNNRHGVALNDANGNVLAGNNISANSHSGIVLHDSKHNSISGNYVKDGGIFLMRGSTTNTVHENVIDDPGLYGIRVFASNNILSGNSITGGPVVSERAEDLTIKENEIHHGGFEFDIAFPEHSDHVFGGGGNTVNGEPVRVVEGEDGVDVPSPAGQVFLFGVSNVTVEGLNLSDTRIGVQAAFSENLTISDNEMTGNSRNGLKLVETTDSSMTGNNLSGNRDWGAKLVFSSDRNVIENNEIHDNHETVGGNGGAISISWSADNQVIANEMTGNGRGMQLFKTTGTIVERNLIDDSRRNGISLVETVDARISENSLTNNRDGIEISRAAMSTEIDGNEIAGNTHGISIEEKFGNAPTRTEIHENNVEGNRLSGLHVDSVEGAVSAWENWWGDETGPAGGVEDACTGEIADGTGDSILTSGVEVCFDPWLTAPNKDAGAG